MKIKLFFLFVFLLIGVGFVNIGACIRDDGFMIEDTFSCPEGYAENLRSGCKSGACPDILILQDDCGKDRKCIEKINPEVNKINVNKINKPIIQSSLASSLGIETEIVEPKKLNEFRDNIITENEPSVAFQTENLKIMQLMNTTLIKNSTEDFIANFSIIGEDYFWFKGLEEVIHSIKIGSEEHFTNIILDGNEFDTKKIINTSENSLIVVNKILIENGTTQVNLTFYETKKNFNNSTEMISNLINKDSEENNKSEMQELSFTESNISFQEQSGKEENKSTRVKVERTSFEKVLNWVKNIFNQKW